eukprot:6462329-Amphidinium_carterae.3
MLPRESRFIAPFNPNQSAGSVVFEDHAAFITQEINIPKEKHAQASFHKGNHGYVVVFVWLAPSHFDSKVDDFLSESFQEQYSIPLQDLVFLMFAACPNYPKKQSASNNG